MTEEIENKIKYKVWEIMQRPLGGVPTKNKYLSMALFGYQLAEKEISEKDRVIAELNLALNEAEKKIKQLDQPQDYYS